MSTTCAPVFITTLNREKHLKRLISSLKNNPLAGRTDVYVGLDYPPSEKYREGYEEVLAYLEEGDFSDFRSFNVIKREENFGPVRNSDDLKRLAGERYDRWIMTEDDNEFSPCFLKYINDGLEMCEKDPSLYAVCGYSYPVKWGEDPGNTVTLDGMFASYGYGILKKNYDSFMSEMTLDAWKKAMKDRRLLEKMESINRLNFNDFVSGVMNYSPYLLAADGFHFRQSDMSQGMYLMLSGKHILMPKVSMVRNWGFDGSGVNCGGSSERNEFSEMEIGTSPDFDIRLMETEDSHREDQRAVDRYFRVKDETLKNAWRMRTLYRILGSRERYHGLGRFLRRFRGGNNTEHDQ